MDKIHWSNWEEQFHHWKIESIYIADQTNIIDHWLYNNEDRSTPIFSATKSILSLLIGIAIEKRIFPALDEPLYTVLQEWKMPLPTVDKRITIEHLLTMTAGWDWPLFDKPYFQLVHSEQVLQDILSASQKHKPGVTFSYNSGCSYLLGVILAKRANMSLLEFAEKHLFEPLHMENVSWNQLGDYHEGGTGLTMRGCDFIKLGQLCLWQGEVAGEQLIPATWITHATKQHHKALLDATPALHGAFGYHWWSTPAERNGFTDCYFAYGFSGQIVVIFPAYNITIAVKRRATNRKDGAHSKQIIFDLILPQLLR
ncbi:serine hydrolase domain-containing protein [Paenibacillus yanchengensis]|uniref:Serine hydrolase domain-containing protein n=1 Tax=Paenibacillus yanchengensis TaxID=2035833 RepID=A0ABW4YLX0_9BACL